MEEPAMTTINDILKEHVTLDIECIDRLYLNGYIPQMQTGGQLVRFLQQRGYAIPSPAILGQLTQQYKREVEQFAAAHGIPVIRFERGARKEDVVAAYRERFAPAEGVVVIGIAQEKANGFKASKRVQGKHVGFDYSRQSLFVNHYYFYLQDADFGPAFIKVCSYAPYTVKVCLNGHEWAKQQCRQRGLAFESLDNGFLSGADPEQLQAICDELGPEQVKAFFTKWQARLPWRLNPTDQQAGFRYRLSVWQAEFSRTQVFADSVQGRQWFEAVIRDNLDVGRPDRIQVLFERRVTKATPGTFRTRVVQEGVSPSLHAYYKQTHVKQYFKEQRALRTETTINNPKDHGVNKDIANLPFLQQLGRQINRRLLDAQRVSFDCVLSTHSLQRLVQPTVTNDGQRAPALRLGEPRVMALCNALTSFEYLPHGLTNQTLRQRVADLLGLDPTQYTAAQMSYDLRRLRLKGIIWRIPQSYRYQLTSYGRKVALLLAKLDARIFRCAFAALDEAAPLPVPLAQALAQVEQAIDDLVNNARIADVAV
jgi:hypothetical protein